ncbi:MAG: VPLPA-CTERM sorting domain-containing protein [Paracoccus sp. (in: a-proteobacteria)]|nr:VPLPA-CTERM sorting domain-containing protein [Paracoccus sp. (in: a-proteobacteria)]
MPFLRSDKSSRRAALFAAALTLLPAAAQAATYTGAFDEGYIRGKFTGIDRNGDSRIEADELVSFSAVLDNMNGGPGQYHVTSSRVSDFLFEQAGQGIARLTGTVTFWFESSGCSNWWTPCWDEPSAGYRMASFAMMMAPYVSGYEVRETVNTTNVTYAVTPAAVPLPAGGMLLAGGLAFFAMARRRS